MQGTVIAVAPASAVTAKAWASTLTGALFVGGVPTGGPPAGLAGPFTNSSGIGMAGVDTTLNGLNGFPYAFDRGSAFSGTAKATGPTLTLATSALSTSDTSIRAVVTETAIAIVSINAGYGARGTGYGYAGGTSVYIKCARLDNGCRVTTSTSRIGHNNECCGPMGCSYPGAHPAPECQLTDQTNDWYTLSGITPLSGDAAPDSGDAGQPMTVIAVSKGGHSIHHVGDTLSMGSSQSIAGAAMVPAPSTNEFSSGFASLSANVCPSTGNCVAVP